MERGRGPLNSVGKRKRNRRKMGGLPEGGGRKQSMIKTREKETRGGKK